MATVHMFVSYSHEDREWVQDGPHGLIPWLAHQLRREDVKIWHDHALRQMPGEEYKKLIHSEIDRAEFAVLLISQDFVASDFIGEHELPRIRERAERDELGLITILVDYVCDEDLGWLADRQMLPGKPTPLIEYTDSTVAWKRVRKDILEAIRNRIRALRESASAAQPNAPAAGRATNPADVDFPVPSSPSVAAPPACADVAVADSPVAPSISIGASLNEPTIPAKPRSSSTSGAAPPQRAGSSPVEKRDAPFPSASIQPAHLETITNSIGMKMVLIPAGQFLMGSPDSDAMAQPNEKPQHLVRITRPFWLAVTPVTWEQAGRVMKVDPAGADPTCPVVRVSWEAAVSFCLCLSEREGVDYRLPTEAQWEYACRAGSTTKWSFGDDESDLVHYGWYSVNARLKSPYPVGQKKPNAWGLFDMHGNVWEWCSDWYGVYVEGALTDPTGPDIGSYRVLRGGSWEIDAAICRSAVRGGNAPSARTINYGFRLALIAAE